MVTYLYRRGNGNEGNYLRAVVELAATENPYAALRALVINDYIPRGRVRSHIARTIEIDGEAEYGLCATVYAGPSGETEFGAAYITADLKPVSEADEAYYRDHSASYRVIDNLRKALDRGAWAVYRKHARDK